MTVKLKCWQLHLSVLKVNLNKLSTLNVYIHLVTLISIKCVAETFTAAIVISCLFQEGYFAFSLVYCISWIDVRWNGINGDFALNNVQGSSPKIGGVKRAMSPTLLTQWRCEHPQTGLKLKSALEPQYYTFISNMLEYRAKTMKENVLIPLTVIQWPHGDWIQAGLSTSSLPAFASLRQIFCLVVHTGTKYNLFKMVTLFPKYFCPRYQLS